MAPIKGMTDRQRRLPRLGKIRLGIKVEQSGAKASYPRAVDYFVCPPAIIQALGDEKPKTLTIVFPNNNADQWASHWYRSYSSYQGLVCRGDGEMATRTVDMDRAVDPTTGALPDDQDAESWPVANRDSTKTGYKDVICDPSTCSVFLAKNCKAVMNLQFMLPDVPGVGVWQLDTGSWNSIHNVLDGIDLVKGLCDGRIGMIPLELALIPLEVRPHDDGGNPLPRKTVHVLRLFPPYYLRDLGHYAELPAGKALMLPAPDLEPPDDLFPGDEPTEVPVEATLDSFGPEEETSQQSFERLLPKDDSEQRQAAWQGIQGYITEKVATKAQVVAWLKKEADLTIGQQLLAKDTPSEGIPTGVLMRLQDALAQRQLQLRDPA